MDIDRLRLLSPEDRKAVLESEASSIEEGTYTKPLSEDELADYKDQLADQSIKQAMILDEFQQVKESYKEKLDPVKKTISTALQAIKFKAIDQIGRLYSLPDYDNKLMYKVDELGNVISSRQMRPEERQYFLKPSKTA